MARAFEPFALELHRRHLAGESVQQLVETLGIPAERIEQRLRAAALYCERRRDRLDLLMLAEEREEVRLRS